MEAPIGQVLKRALALEHGARYRDGFEFADALGALDVAEVPVVDKRSARLSLMTLPHSGEAPEFNTPRMGHRRPVSGDFASSESALAFDSEAAFANTVEVGATQRALSVAGPPLRVVPGALPAAPSLPDGAIEIAKKAGDDGEVIVHYNSRAPYVLAVGLLIALLAVVVAMLVESKKPVKVPPVASDVITSYDRELARLRDQADALPELLESGEIDALLARVKEMDEEKTRLTPREVSEIQELGARARSERVNQRRLVRASERAEQRDYVGALEAIRDIPPTSVFANHPDRETVVGRSLVALIIRIQERSVAADFDEATRLLDLLLAVDPDNEELKSIRHNVQREQDVLHDRLQQSAESASESLIEVLADSVMPRSMSAP